MRKVPVQFVVQLTSSLLSVGVLALVFNYLHVLNIAWMMVGYFMQQYIVELWKRTKLEEDSKRL